MKRIIAISDIHGELDMLRALLKTTQYSKHTDQLILLGDYVDRGPDSKGVIDMVRSLADDGAIVLRGNHDQMMIDAYYGRDNGWERWMRNHCESTLRTYDCEISGAACPLSQAFQAHVEFLDSLPYFYETDDYIFVHAGVVPGEHPSESDTFKLIWIREDFYEHYNGHKTVIFGHTPTPFLNGKEETRYSEVYLGTNNIIGIDGAATYGGRLNALILPSGETCDVMHPDYCID